MQKYIFLSLSFLTLPILCSDMEDLKKSREEYKKAEQEYQSADKELSQKREKSAQAKEALRTKLTEIIKKKVNTPSGDKRLELIRKRSLTNKPSGYDDICKEQRPFYVAYRLCNAGEAESCVLLNDAIEADNLPYNPWRLRSEIREAVEDWKQWGAVESAS